MASARPDTPPAPERLQAAIDAIQANPRYQLELPSLPTPPQLNRPAWLDAVWNWLSGPGRIFANVLLALGCALALLYILYLTVPSVRDAIDGLLARLGRRTDAQGVDDAPWQPDVAAARSLLEQADALAKAGAFGEAVHLLLRHSLVDIDRRRPDVLRPALTARAIASIEALPGAARRAFSTVVGIVERSRWAGQDLHAQDWSEARSAYEDFAFGSHWRAAAG